MRIAHTVWEALYRAPITRLDCQVFCLLLRRSWGFSSKTVAISTETISIELDRSQRNVQLAIKSLIDCNMVVVVENANKYKPGTYAPNKMYSEWNFQRIPRDQYDRSAKSSERSIRSRGMSILIARRDDFDRAAGKIEGEKPDEQGVCGTTNTCSKKLFKETLKEIPPTPKGEGEGFDSPDHSSDSATGSENKSPIPNPDPLREHLAEQLRQHTGCTPSKRNIDRALAIFRRATPHGWDAKGWRRKTTEVFSESLRVVKAEVRAGKPCGSIAGLACARAEQILGILSLEPPRDTLEDRNVVYKDE